MSWAVLFDLSSVLYIGRKPIPGAIESIEYLCEILIPIRFKTKLQPLSHDELKRS